MLKLNNGKHVAMDATLIHSIRRAKKVLKTNQVIKGGDGCFYNTPIYDFINYS
jgi:hypothetical protein